MDLTRGSDKVDLTREQMQTRIAPQSMMGGRPDTYLIFVTNAANAVHVNFLAECKKIPEELFWAPFISQQ